MGSCEELLKLLEDGQMDESLQPLYGLDEGQNGVKEGRLRVQRVIQGFLDQFYADGDVTQEAALFSGPGRTELGGNHTDHQRGHVLCASVDLDMLACAAPNHTRRVQIYSEGYPMLAVDLEDLEYHSQEVNSSGALVRGVAARLVQMGYQLGGMDVYITSTVLSGSGLSSSAAYEILLGTMFNHFFCKGALDPIQLAKVGQYAENQYFGKPCGLMDQMGSSVGGAVAIDFADPVSPLVTKVEYPFETSGYTLCVVDTGSCHADLTDDYAEITQEMGQVAAYFGEEVLSQVEEKKVWDNLPALRAKCGDRAVLRTLHFFAEDRRAVQEAQVLAQGEFETFLKLVNESGDSSSLYLQNTWSPSNPKQQAIPVALAVGRTLLQGKGAIRVHGGGFAGTIQAFVPKDRMEAFQNGMEALLGQGMCHWLHIRPVGGCVLWHQKEREE